METGFRKFDLCHFLINFVITITFKGRETFGKDKVLTKGPQINFLEKA